MRRLAKGLAAENPWKPSIHMPRWASRLSLDVTAVRVERLQDISEEDAWAEGVEEVADEFVGGDYVDAAVKWSAAKQGKRICLEDSRVAYVALWDSINAKRVPWASNPWVWVVEFRRAT